MAAPRGSCCGALNRISVKSQLLAEWRRMMSSWSFFVTPVQILCSGLVLVGFFFFFKFAGESDIAEGMALIGQLTCLV